MSVPTVGSDSRVGSECRAVRKYAKKYLDRDSLLRNPQTPA